MKLGTFGAYTLVIMRKAGSQDETEVSESA